MCTSEEMVVTTTSITAVSESMRSAQSAFKSPKVMNENIGTRASWPPKPTSKKAYQDSTQAITSNVEVISSAAREPAAAGSVGSSSCAPCSDDVAWPWLSSACGA